MIYNLQNQYMKKIIFFALMLLGTLSYAQKLDCSKFKNIKFGAPVFPNEYIIRKDSIQEGYMDGKVQTVWTVKWLTGCKVEAVCVKNFGSPDIKVGDRYISEFIDISDDCFTVSMLYFDDQNPNGMDFTRGFCIMKD